MKRFLFTLSLLTFVLLDVFILVSLYWYLKSYRPIEIIEGPTVVNANKTVRVHEVLHYQFSYCKYMDVPATIEKEFLDGVRYVVPPITTYNPKTADSGVSCTDKNAVPTVGSVEVPNIPPGKYKLQLEFTYQVNPIQRVSVKTITEEFIIKEATDAEKFE